MGEPVAKERILKAVEELPDDATLDEAIEKLCFLAKVERGLIAATNAFFPETESRQIRSSAQFRS